MWLIAYFRVVFGWSLVGQWLDLVWWCLHQICLNQSELAGKSKRGPVAKCLFLRPVLCLVLICFYLQWSQAFHGCSSDFTKTCFWGWVLYSLSGHPSIKLPSWIKPTLTRSGQFFQSNWSHYNLVTRFKDHIQNKRFSGCSFIQSTTNGCFLLQQLYGFCWPAGHTICPTSTVSL